jgi:hypothetical protein
MLLKPFQTVFIPQVPATPAHPYKRLCPSQGGGSPGGSTPTPGQRCTTIIIYGPPSPIDGGPTVIGTTTVCV